MSRHRYYLPELTCWLRNGRAVVFMTDNAKRWKQGEWMVGGEMMGGYSVHPVRDLNEDLRREAIVK